ncbi:hypothetical protein [Bradyrhizobium genosp. P]
MRKACAQLAFTTRIDFVADFAAIQMTGRNNHGNVIASLISGCEFLH